MSKNEIVQMNLKFDPDSVIDLDPAKDKEKQPQPDVKKLNPPDDPYASLGGGLPSRKKSKS